MHCEQNEWAQIVLKYYELSVGKFPACYMQAEGLFIQIPAGIALGILFNNLIMFWFAWNIFFIMVVLINDPTIYKPGMPRRVRADCGTENVLVAEIQRELTGDDNSFMYGRSTSNQV